MAFVSSAALAILQQPNILRGGAFALQTAGDIFALEERYVITLSVVPLDFITADRERRPFHQSLVIFPAN
jgi:hypothetical protein